MAAHSNLPCSDDPALGYLRVLRALGLLHSPGIPNCTPLLPSQCSRDAAECSVAFSLTCETQTQSVLHFCSASPCSQPQLPGLPPPREAPKSWEQSHGLCLVAFEAKKSPFFLSALLNKSWQRCQSREAPGEAWQGEQHHPQCGERREERRRAGSTQGQGRGERGAGSTPELGERTEGLGAHQSQGEDDFSFPQMNRSCFSLVPWAPRGGWADGPRQSLPATVTPRECAQRKTPAAPSSGLLRESRNNSLCVHMAVPSLRFLQKTGGQSDPPDFESLGGRLPVRLTRRHRPCPPKPGCARATPHPQALEVQRTLQEISLQVIRQGIQ